MERTIVTAFGLGCAVVGVALAVGGVGANENWINADHPAACTTHAVISGILYPGAAVGQATFPSLKWDDPNVVVAIVECTLVNAACATLVCLAIMLLVRLIRRRRIFTAIRSDPAENGMKPIPLKA